MKTKNDFGQRKESRGEKIKIVFVFVVPATGIWTEMLLKSLVQSTRIRSLSILGLHAKYSPPVFLCSRHFCIQHPISATTIPSTDDPEPLNDHENPPSMEITDEMFKMAEITDEAEVFRLKALNFYASGQYEEALINFEKALEIHPQDIRAKHQKGVVLLRLDRAEEAIECFDSILEFCNDPHSLIMKAEALFDMHKYEEALEILNKAITITKDVAKESDKNFETEDPASLATAYVLSGYIFEIFQQNEKAHEAFHEAVELSPNDGYFRYRYAASLEAIGNIEQAKIEYDRAVELGNIEQAKIEYDRAVELEPTPEIILARGHFLLQQKFYLDALLDFEMVKEMGCHDEETEFQLYGSWGAVLVQLEKPSDAIEKFNLALEKLDHQSEEGTAIVYHNRALAFVELKEYQKAISDFEDALELDPENTEHVAQLNLVKEKIKLIKE